MCEKDRDDNPKRSDANKENQPACFLIHYENGDATRRVPKLQSIQIRSHHCEGGTRLGTHGYFGNKDNANGVDSDR